jgi:Mrp family chromosome partitioning ATPase
MYQNTAEQLQAAYIAEDSEPGYAQIIRKASVPAQSVYPDTTRNIILGAFFGLLFGLGLAIGREKLDNRIYQPEQLRQMGLKEIGVVPNLKPMLKKEFKGEAFLKYNGQKISSSLISLHTPVSATSEVFRNLRTQIQFGLSGKSVHTLLVASPGMSEGKSTTASNLAIVMAQAGRKTLLIDADLRRPKLHKLFGLPLESGLAQVLTEDSHDDPESWATSIENLSVITAGSLIIKGDNKVSLATREDDTKNKTSLNLNPSELIGSERMLEFLAAMRKKFDMIIIDSPPVLVATDARLLSTQCDSTIIVARSGVTREEELSLAVETLEDVGASINGIILNGFEINMAFGHMYKYQYYTKYGHYDSNYGVRDNT